MENHIRGCNRGAPGRRVITDAEFMLEYVARERKECEKIKNDLHFGVLYSQKRNTELDALEALVNLKWDWHNLGCVDSEFGGLCEYCDALRRFRAAMEGK